MKFFVFIVGLLSSFVLFCASAAFSLDREAFSITKYDLNLQVEAAQHRLGVRGRITLRNDSAVAQKTAVLQISSSLDWRAMKAGDTAVEFVTQPYASDIDHTGALSEAVVTLPSLVTPHATVELEIAYEGVILLDATRLTRIGTPEDQAQSSDWDQIGSTFTAVRGAGYVAWYPIATEVANLSEGTTMFDVLRRWKAREAGARFKIKIGAFAQSPDAVPAIMFNGSACRYEDDPRGRALDCEDEILGLDPPSFVIADYMPVESTAAIVDYLPAHKAAASIYAEAADRISPFISDWFGKPTDRTRVRIADLPDPKASPFESRWLLFTPLNATDAHVAGLVVAHQLAHASFSSSRPWINEGLAHFAQALYLEQSKNRLAALDYMGVHRAAFLAAEKDLDVNSEMQVQRSLVNTTSEELYRSKAMYVWWMLRDMVGDAALKKAIAAYHPEQDKEPSYMPRLIAAQTQGDLEWFFDDWVYRDRGLPDFKVESAFARKTLTNAYMVTITVDNLGSAGAEVPVIVKFAGGDVAKRLEVRGKNKATIRVEVPGVPAEIVVNDGSVPESDMGNNVYKMAGEK